MKGKYNYGMFLIKDGGTRRSVTNKCHSLKRRWKIISNGKMDTVRRPGIEWKEKQDYFPILKISMGITVLISRVVIITVIWLLKTGIVRANVIVFLLVCFLVVNFETFSKGHFPGKKGFCCV